MFYYISDYYNTSAQATNSDYATLVYYNNVSAGSPNNTKQFQYNSNDNNYEGPRTAMLQLPTTLQWQDAGLYKNARQILATSNFSTYSTSTTGGDLPTAFSYRGYSARLLTTNELKLGCPSASTSNDSLDSCPYLLENTYYQNTSYISRYWLETVYQGTKSHIYGIDSYHHNITTSSSYGVRPAIEVKKADLDNSYIPTDKYIIGTSIESSGTQYINTGYIPSDAGGKIEAKFNMTSISTSAYGYVYGIENSSSPYNALFARVRNSTFEVASYTGASKEFAGATSGIDYIISHEWVRNSSTSVTNIAGLNGYYDSKTISSTSEVIKQIPLYIFADNISGSADRKASMKLYYLKIYDKNGNLVRHYLPAKQLSNNAVGLYDIITATFYPNNGTGSFVFDFNYTGFITQNGNTYYYVSGVRQTGWKQISGNYYYFNTNGVMEHDCYRGGYYLDQNGIRTSTTGDWQQSDSRWWYRLNGNNNQYLTGLHKIDGTYYFFYTDTINSANAGVGYMAYNEFINGYWYNEDGTRDESATYSWHQDATGWFYSSSQTGWIASGKSYWIDGVQYTFNSSGYLAN